MKKHILISTVLIAAISFGYSSTLKGSDYISTQPGTTYIYQRVEANDNDNFTIRTKIKDCNDDNTLCRYVSSIKDHVKKKIDGSESKYAYDIKNGAVYIKYPNSDKETLLLPANIEFNKVRNEDNSNANGKFTNSYEFTKQIPEITVNGNKYKNCIELEAKSDMTIDNKPVKTQSQEIYCKGVGLVKENFKETDASGTPVIYKSILVSMKKP
ncbi:hypothetical protein [Francisella sp. LA112445]|uniref:hypothetical protein n=1 Tax=Francisella sp. LA112445 TaxID=1395624 RepID=UPI001788B68F|nr:hypothetical protein [Francisella sp. LA112445]QIW10944.1 hypothetical protein FIP56_09645 [Francisella sp. LA112445]